MAESRWQRHWSDTALAIAALFVSAVSLWIGIRTEVANEELVAASTWPFLQVQISNADPDAKLDLQFQVVNTGVGPAKVESFELFWKGKPYRSGTQLLTDCCGYREIKATSPEAANHTPLLKGTVQGMVLRAGEAETFIHYKLGADNLAVWSALDKARNDMTYRVCYCSVLDQCWRSALQSEIYLAGQLHPERVNSCAAPAVSYTN
ncbi:MAG TPA: hypothetical protein VG889_18525 [Rhizomicrobium sp.]|nr:hypothetical protein [Rhizomicrobium sp.]